MKIQKFLSKPAWIRINDCDISPTPGTSALNSGSLPMGLSRLNRQLLSQDDFLRELEANCHLVHNVAHRSNRPKFKYNRETKVNEADGFDYVTRVAVSWQLAIANKKTSCCFGNAPEIANEGDESQGDMVNELKSKLNTMNIRSCLSDVGDSLFKTGDVGIYFFKDGKEINYKVYSYAPSSGGGGSNCTEVNDPEIPGEMMGVRYFSSNEREAIELYRKEKVEFYVKPKSDNDDLASDYGEIEGTKTDDGFVLVTTTSHGLPVNPFVYFRVEDVPWGSAQDNIEYWEQLISDCGENVKYYAYQILFLTGGTMSLPQHNFQGKVIGSKSEKGDAKMLQPANASDTLSIALNTTFNAIKDTSSSVFIRMDELKGQNDSGAYLRNLYHPEIEYANRFYAKFNKAFKSILKITAAITGRIMETPASYLNLEISHKFEPFVPKNDYEDSRIVNESYTAGTLSQKTAAEEHPRSHPKEVSRIVAETDSEVTEEDE